MLTMESLAPRDCISRHSQAFEDVIRNGTAKNLRQHIECLQDHIVFLRANLRSAFLGRQMSPKARVQRANQLMEDGVNLLADIQPKLHLARELATSNPGNKALFVILELEKPVNELMQLIEETAERRDNFVSKHPQLAE